MDDKPAAKPTITIAEANMRAEDYADRATQALFPDVPIEPGLAEKKGDCSDPTDNGPTNRLLATRSYRVKQLDPESIPQYFNSALQWWSQNNFALIEDKSEDVTRFANAENRHDGFRMSLQSNDSGGLVLYATSPCVWPNGTPEPEPSEGH